VLHAGVALQHMLRNTCTQKSSGQITMLQDRKKIINNNNNKLGNILTKIGRG